MTDPARIWARRVSIPGRHAPRRAAETLRAQMHGVGRLGRVGVAGGAVLIASCGDGATADESIGSAVVAVAAQPCDRPTRDLGVGVVVDVDRHGDVVVATAAHTVDGDLRDVTVDGRPAGVVLVDARTDLALITARPAEGPVRALELAGTSDSTPATARLVTPDGTADVDIVATGPLVVYDTTDRRRHRRLVHRFAPGVTAGTSGAPLVDNDGRVLGIVVLDRADTAYAVTAAELADVLDAGRRAGGADRSGGCQP